MTYSGVYGAIMNDEYDQASTAFLRNLERDGMFDFSISFIYIQSDYLMDVDKATKLDWTLYIRPLHRSAW